MAKRKTAAVVVSRLDMQEDGIEPRILLIRGQKVLLDRDLATLYEVKPTALRQQIKQNPKRFPPDFVFELKRPEVEALLSQNVIASRSVLGGSAPLAFTEQGIAMLSAVLTSDRAVEVNLIIMRTFVKMRKLLAGHEELARRLAHDAGSEPRVVFWQMTRPVGAHASNVAKRAAVDGASNREATVGQYRGLEFPQFDG